MMNHQEIHHQIEQLREAFESKAKPGDAKSMKAYMKNQFEFHGCKSPVRKEIQGPFIKQWLRTKEVEQELCLSLWEKAEREYQLVAIDYLRRTSRYWQVEHIDFFKRLIQSKSWWDTVDLLASTMVGGVVSTYPMLKEVMEEWNKDSDMWLIRSSIIHQLKYKEEVDFEQLTRFILNHQHSKEFFINKASGWALRQYAKFQPELVKDFVAAHSLAPLTVREALKHLH